MLLLADPSSQGLRLAVVDTGTGPQRMRFESGLGWYGLFRLSLPLSDKLITFDFSPFASSFRFSFLLLFLLREGGRGGEGSDSAWREAMLGGQAGGILGREGGINWGRKASMNQLQTLKYSGHTG